MFRYLIMDQTIIAYTIHTMLILTLLENEILNEDNVILESPYYIHKPISEQCVLSDMILTVVIIYIMRLAHYCEQHA